MAADQPSQHYPLPLLLLLPLLLPLLPRLVHHCLYHRLQESRARRRLARERSCVVAAAGGAALAGLENLAVVVVGSVARESAVAVAAAVAAAAAAAVAAAAAESEVVVVADAAGVAGKRRQRCDQHLNSAVQQEHVEAGYQGGHDQLCPRPPPPPNNPASQNLGCYRPYCLQRVLQHWSQQPGQLRNVHQLRLGRPAKLVLRALGALQLLPVVAIHHYRHHWQCCSD